jgi:hypothetical protein
MAMAKFKLWMNILTMYDLLCFSGREEQKKSRSAPLNGPWQAQR